MKFIIHCKNERKIQGKVIKYEGTEYSFCKMDKQRHKAKMVRRQEGRGKLALSSGRRERKEQR